MAIDLKMTTSGELVLNSHKDLDLSYGSEQLATQVLFRLKTTKGDWTLQPEIGCDLEKFIGAPNTPETHSRIEAEVLDQLTFDGLLLTPRVDCVPIDDKNTILIIVEFPDRENDNRVVQVISSLDLRKGVVYSKIGSFSI